MHPSQLIQISNFSPFTLRYLSTFLLSTIRAGAGWLASELASLSGGWTWQASEARQGAGGSGRAGAAPPPHAPVTHPHFRVGAGPKGRACLIKTSRPRTVSAASRASHLLPGQHHPVNNPPRAPSQQHSLRSLAQPHRWGPIRSKIKVNLRTSQSKGRDVAGWRAGSCLPLAWESLRSTIKNWLLV